jgi:hypothetical protein
MRNISEETVKKMHFVFSNFFSDNRAVCEIMWKKFLTAGKVTDKK